MPAKFEVGKCYEQFFYRPIRVESRDGRRMIVSGEYQATAWVHKPCYIRTDENGDEYTLSLGLGYIYRLRATQEVA